MRVYLSCVIGTIGSSNSEYQHVNSTTQVASFTLCIGNCSFIEKITWNIYSGEQNSSINYSQWILFNQINTLESLWFFGIKVILHQQIKFWKFEVVYSFGHETSRSSLNFVINQPPQIRFSFDFTIEWYNEYFIQYLMSKLV